MASKTAKDKSKRVKRKAIKTKSNRAPREGSVLKRGRAPSKNMPESSSKTPPTESTPPPRSGEVPISGSGKEKVKRQIGYSLNWNRAIHINRTIDESLVKELTPLILKMKQESSEPITVGIDSPGGSLAAVDSLLGLLNSPDQDGKVTLIYTVSTNRAYSAAASLLAFGDYAVSFSHSRILYHDLRYSGIEDVTPSKALKTARELERGNVAFALRLAHHIRGRLIWVYLDLMSEFKRFRSEYETFAKRYDEAFEQLLPPKQEKTVDVVGFSLALFRKLSNPADHEIAIRALYLLNSWMQIERIERRLSAQKSGAGALPDPVEGVDRLITEIRGMEAGAETPSKSPTAGAPGGLAASAREDIKLLLEVVARRFANDKDLTISDEGLDMIVEDFSFIRDIKSDKHVHAITKMMIENGPLFFGRSIADDIKNAKDNTERRKILAPVYPQARMLWYFIVLICRCLCKGDHFLSPGDAQLLGLVDEVLGGGPIQSVREWRKTSPEYQ